MKNKIAILLPCYNEELAIAQVIKDFQRILPQAEIYVYDNNSTDNTYQKAQDAGAIVRCEKQQGKGYVVQRMFADIEADIYLMADGDGTYDVNTAPLLIQALNDKQLDMVVGCRQASEGAYRSGHAWGNRLFNYLLKSLFKSSFQDIFSGYRAFSRRFVKSFPALSGGFDIETELSVHALELRLPFEEISSRYSKRVEGAESKLKTYADGFKILMRMFSLFKHQRPLLFFNIFAVFFMIGSCVLFWPVWKTYQMTGLVPRIPTTILCAALSLLSILFFICGLVLDSLTYTRTTLKRLIYLNCK